MSGQGREQDYGWIETADRVTDGDPRILGEDDCGDLYVPTNITAGQERWARRFQPCNPLHWRYWLRSRRTRRIAWLERE